MNLEHKIRGRVFGSLQPGTIDIQIGYDYGMNDGGGLRRLKRELVPEDCRFPNTYVWITLSKGDVVLIEKMKEEDVEIHKRNS